MKTRILKMSLASLGLLLVASFLTTKTFRAEITIAAPPEKVWAVLMDTQSYPDWNPTFVAVSPPYALGAKISSRVVKPDGAFIDMTPTVTALVTNRELRQSGGLPGVLTYNHAWLLAPVHGGTHVRQIDVDRGGFLWFWDTSWIEPAYQRANEALAARVLALQE
ncbi:MAG: SRPBCC domain-containing protein [Parvibaculales bacterium]